MQVLKEKRGFTLVELSLSVVFIAILSITIVLIINNAVSTYRRGMTLNQINTVGMDLVDDMRAAIQSAPATMNDNCKDDDGYKEECVNVRKTASVNVNGVVKEEIPVYGAFCTGSYSYIWNSGYFYAEGGSKVLGGVSKAKFRGKDYPLIRIKDKEREICSQYSSSFDGNFDLDSTEELEIILADDAGSQLALYDLYAPLPAVNSQENAA